MPFTHAQFFAVFAAYNEAVWPAQWLWYAGAVACAILAVRARPLAGRLAGGFLAALWAWMALAYHAAWFSRINPAAWIFCGAFLLAAAAFAWHGVIRANLEFDGAAGPRRAIGIALVLVALAGYPAASFLAGHRFPAAPTFGLPCPSTIFTLGMLLLARPPVPRPVAAVPVAWAVFGSLATLKLGVPQDALMMVAVAVYLAAPARHGIATRLSPRPRRAA